MKFLSVFLFLLSTACCNAQIVLPPLSPRAELKQQAGFTNMLLNYGRPAARGRTIMGELVKYGQLWRTGAGPCTRLSFDKPVQINNKIIAAGTYALVSIPNKKNWTIMLNSDTSRLYGHPSEYDTKTEVARFEVNPEKASRFYESLTFDFDVVDNDAVLYLLWEHTQIHFSILTRTDEAAMLNIREALNNDPDNYELLSQATEYYLIHNKDLGEALQMVDKALQLNEDRWLYRQKIEILNRQKRYEAAKQTTEKAIAFLQRTKPQEWEEEIRRYKNEKSHWQI